jgi:hypothetical protein
MSSKGQKRKMKEFAPGHILKADPARVRFLPFGRADDRKARLK